MRLTSFTAATVAVMAGSALLVASPGASSADPTRSSAYGVSVNAGGQPAVPPTPFVESTDGSTKTTGGAEAIPSQAAPLLAGDVLALSAGDDEASVEVTDLEIGNVGDQIPPELKEQFEALQQACEELRGSGGSRLPDLGELPIPVPQPSPEDFQRVLRASRRRVRQPRQPRHAAMSSATVTPVPSRCSEPACSGYPFRPRTWRTSRRTLELFPGQPAPPGDAEPSDPGPRGAFTVDGLVISLGEGQAEAVVASTTCGEGIPQAAGGTTEAPTAPAPIPQQGSAPVTG